MKIIEYEDGLTVIQGNMTLWLTYDKIKDVYLSGLCLRSRLMRDAYKFAIKLRGEK